MTEYPYLTDLPLDDLVKNAANPNEQDERMFNATVESIQEEGWIQPCCTVVEVDGKWEIVSGHHRYDAAVVLGFETVPCWVLDPEKFDKDRRDWVMVKANVIAGQLNPAKFTALYERMVNTYGAEVLQALMGFTDEDAFRKVYQDVRKALPPELAKALDATKDEIKTIDGLALVLNRLFREYGENLPSNFMTFSWAGKDVLWVQCDTRLWKAVKAIEAAVVKGKLDMTEVLGEALDGVAGSLNERVEKVESAPQTLDAAG